MADCNIADIIPADSKNHILAPAVEECIERIIQKQGVVVKNVIVQNIHPDGGNFSSSLQTIEVIEKSKNDVKQIHLFIKNKLIFTDQKLVPFDEMFKREAFYYNELVPIYNKLQENAKVPVNARFKVIKSFEESNGDVTILEDLSKRGYRSTDRREPMSLQFAELSVKELAKFHALSFVLQDREPEYFNQRIKSLEILIEPESDFETLIDCTCDTALEFLDEDSKYRLAKFKPSLKTAYRKPIKISKTIPSCLCHGDFRHNNVMIIEKNGEIKDLVVIDYQLIYYGSPIMDLLYFIFVGSDRKLRMNHLEEIKGIYYETFKSFLEYFDINAEHVYSKERFEREYRNNLDYGIASFMLLVPFLFCDDDSIPDLENGISEVNVNINNEEYKERLHEVVTDFIQWGYL